MCARRKPVSAQFFLFFFLLFFVNLLLFFTSCLPLCLGAEKHFYQRVRPSVLPSVNQSVRPSVSHIRRYRSASKESIGSCFSLFLLAYSLLVLYSLTLSISLLITTTMTTMTTTVTTMPTTTPTTKWKKMVEMKKRRKTREVGGTAERDLNSKKPKRKKRNRKKDKR